MNDIVSVCSNEKCKTGDIAFNWRSYYGLLPEKLNCPVCNSLLIPVIRRNYTPLLRDWRHKQLTLLKWLNTK